MQVQVSGLSSLALALANSSDSIDSMVWLQGLLLRLLATGRGAARTQQAAQLTGVVALWRGWAVEVCMGLVTAAMPFAAHLYLWHAQSGPLTQGVGTSQSVWVPQLALDVLLYVQELPSPRAAAGTGTGGGDRDACFSEGRARWFSEVWASPALLSLRRAAGLSIHSYTHARVRAHTPTHTYTLTHTHTHTPTILLFVWSHKSVCKGGQWEGGGSQGNCT